MLLEDVLAGLSNETEVINSQVRLDHADKLVVYMEPGILRNSTVATEVGGHSANFRVEHWVVGRLRDEPKSDLSSEITTDLWMVTVGLHSAR